MTSSKKKTAKGSAAEWNKTQKRFANLTLDDVQKSEECQNSDKDEFERSQEMEENKANNSESRSMKEETNYDEIADDEDLPDSWIDRYVNGNEELKTTSKIPDRSSIKGLEPYSGLAIDWIDLFQSLVHNSSRQPGDKLAVLKINLKGRSADLVIGLGGREKAYEEALKRFKESCGRRDVSKAVGLKATSQLEAPKSKDSI